VQGGIVFGERLSGWPVSLWVYIIRPSPPRRTSRSLSHRPAISSAHLSQSFAHAIKARELDNSMALAPNIIPSARLRDNDFIECLDLTTSLPTKSLDPFSKPALDFKGTLRARTNTPGVTFSVLSIDVLSNNDF